MCVYVCACVKERKKFLTLQSLIPLLFSLAESPKPHGSKYVFCSANYRLDVSWPLTEERMAKYTKTKNKTRTEIENYKHLDMLS